MTPLEHIRQNPKKCKQLTGLSSVQLEKIILQASEMDKKKKKESQEKVVNKKGAGRPKTLKTQSFRGTKSDNLKVMEEKYLLETGEIDENDWDKTPVSVKNLVLKLVVSQGITDG